MRFLLKTTFFLLTVALVLGGVVLAWGHVHIRRIAPPLPDPELVLTPDPSLDLPVRLTWLNTASQRMPRAAVLDPSRDPDPEGDFVMSHPAFAIEWQDGRIFLVDAGLDKEGAIDFGLPMELAAGADPIEPHRSASAQLGEHRERVAGIGFTHLHVDHTTGLDTLCADRRPAHPDEGPKRIGLFQHANQIVPVNHTTHGPKAQVQAASCIESRALGSDSGLLAVPGFDGLYAIPVGGHTPGSTMWVVQLRVHPGASAGRSNDVQTWVITGDVVNHSDAVRLGIAKPPLYSLLVVPENEERLAAARGFLKTLFEKPGVKLLVNHDKTHIEQTGLRSF